jgi:hypothetical protein
MESVEELDQQISKNISKATRAGWLPASAGSQWPKFNRKVAICAIAMGKQPGEVVNQMLPEERGSRKLMILLRSTSESLLSRR